MHQSNEIQTYRKLDEVLDQIIQRWELPGLAVGIVDQDEIAYLKTTGVQSLETHIPITDQTRFCIASVSKTIVASTVMRLVEDGLVFLDAPVQTYLPYFHLVDARSKQITLRQVLSHTSGMPDMDEVAYSRFWKNPEVDEGAAERYVRGLAGLVLVNAPGQAFQYSNIGYNILGDLIAKASGTSFETYTCQNIMLPSGMASSTFLLDEVPVDLLAWPHLRLPSMTASPIYPYHRADGPSSNLHTTILDLCSLAQTCLNQGKVVGKNVLQPASFETMWTPVVKRGWPPLYDQMGLGWNLGSYQGFKTASHGGAGPGMNAFLLVLPGARKAAALLCNTESSAIDYLVDAVLDTLVGLEPQPGPVDWMVPVCQAMAKGGKEAAFERAEEIQRQETPEYSFERQSLIGVVYQMVMADHYQAAIDLLDLTSHFYPDFGYAIFLRAQVNLELGDSAHARQDLMRLLEIHPDHKQAARLLEELPANP